MNRTRKHRTTRTRMHCDASMKYRAEKQQQQQQTSDWFLHISVDEFISHMNFLLHFLKHKNKNLNFCSFCTNEESLFPSFSTGVQVLHLPSILHHSAFVIYTAFPSMPLLIHTQGHTPLHQQRWRDGMKRKKNIFPTTRCRCFPKQKNQSVNKNSAPVGKRPFLIGSFLFCA